MSVTEEAWLTKLFFSRTTFSSEWLPEHLQGIETDDHEETFREFLRRKNDPDMRVLDQNWTLADF